MVFWIGILIGCLFAWLAVKMGFYETWVLLFNIIIAVYLAVFLGPVIARIVPISRNSPYNNALGVIAAGIGGFLILYGISCILFTGQGQFKVRFTKTLDTCVAGFLGFLTGFLIWVFFSLLICITPISQNTFVSELEFAGGFRQTGIPYISLWCDLVNSIVASEDSEVTSKQIINELLKISEPNTPAEPNRSDNIRTSPIMNPSVDIE